ncbi:dehydrogenase/reductase [Hypoxylon fragiforme]|uniref:dehydrogenase/reductase n=1 Tax=Hypoxylon fragiforme TaxID=63214 RepID=UPI0020C64166|nr:dehydrogenase/reductase [Hypoxylon fragiforme]KAI2603416.1 dehydrogenase/reductase [Hypoxylon fragiforme]
MSYTRSAIVTGGTINLGFHAATEIARQHPDWLIVISSRSNREHAASKINQLLKQNNTIFLPIDLADPNSVRTFSKNWTSKNHPPIQALLLNAGLQFPGKLTTTPEGIESTFAINHIGHALLFHLLCPHLAPHARVVLTSSGTHDPAMKSGLPDALYTSAEDLAHPPPSIANGDGRRHYANSKLANILWTYAAHRRLGQSVPDRGVVVAAFDPGLMPGTGLAREYPPLMNFLWWKVLPRVVPVLKCVYTENIHTPGESGASLAWLATMEEGGGGKYFEGRKEIMSSEGSYDEKKQDDLWSWTVRHVARDEAEVERFEAFG